MRHLIIAFLLTSFLKVYSQSTVIICNGSFEGPENSTFPNFSSQIPNSTCWKDLQVFSNNSILRSPDWYKFDQYYVEEDIDGDGVFSPISGNRGVGYSGVRVCELLYQKVNIPLKKDISYALRFHYRFPGANNRVHQTPTRIFDINPVELRVILSKNKLDFDREASVNCEEVKRCDFLKSKGAAEEYNILLSPNLGNTGTWQRHELLFTLNAALNPDYEYLSLIINDNIEGEICDAYLLIDDISITPICNGEAEEFEWCNGCSFTDGAIGVYTNGENNFIMPLTLFGMSNVHTMTYTIINSAGQAILGPLVETCNNGWLDDTYKFSFPPNFDAGNYIIEATFSNDCFACEKEIPFIYSENFDGLINNKCRPQGLIEPCCENEIVTNEDIYGPDPNGMVVQPISNLFIQNTIVNPNTTIDFKAGNKIEVTQNTILSGEGNVRLFLESCNEERSTPVNSTPIQQSITEDELLFENEISPNEILIYPNPTNATFFIQNIKEQFNLKIYTSRGVLVKSFVLQPNQKVEISTEGWSKGLFYLNFSNLKGFSLNHKIVVY